LRGLDRMVVMDDYLPTVDGRVHFARPVGKELWVCMIEKAYAKVNSSYCNIIGGWPAAVLKNLTGAPSYRKAVQDADCEQKMLEYK